LNLNSNTHKHRMTFLSYHWSYSLSEANEVFVIGVHVGQLDFNEHHQLTLHFLLILTDSHIYDPLTFVTEPRISNHLTVSHEHRHNVTHIILHSKQYKINDKF